MTEFYFANGGDFGTIVAYCAAAVTLLVGGFIVWSA